ncbi:MAG TPA: dipeptide epimerase [Chitinophagaceae bacterium]|nr:dipeptide epimerase [Chitinophagaceae bacterium]
MKIKSVNIAKRNLRLSKPYSIAFKTIDVVENGIIEITADDGSIGYGAFNPSYEVMGETLEHAMEAFETGKAEWLCGTDISSRSVFDEVLAKVAIVFAGSPSARIGLDMALYDLYAQSLGIPIVQLWGQKIIEMPTSITIGIKGVNETLEEAGDYLGRKFKILKVKLGVAPEEDVERLVKLREVYGYGVDIIIDMNQGYSGPQMQWFYNRVKHLGIRLIEQPFKKGEEALMRALDEDIKQLVAADESLIDAGDAVNLAAQPKACGFFNIKLMKCGGIQEALAIAGIAQNNNIGLMWGCNDESIISITAALHLAFVCPHTKFIDLDGSFDLAEDVVTGGFILKDGVMSIPPKPGLGLQKI